VDEHNQPNLKPLLGASEVVGRALSKGDYVVYESTVYPGCTEEDCVPVLERISGLQFRTDFKVGYSPERINPGDKVHTLLNTVKIVSGCDEETLNVVAAVYESVLENGVHRASNIKVAEAAKIVENTQRDVNIALMNELSIIFGRMGINTYEVIEAAGTKWNFLNFHPGLVGGHCIGVDPYYLTYKASQLGYHAQMIDSGRYVNDSMGGYIAKQTVKRLLSAGKNPQTSRVLVMGITFKENVPDIRNSKVVQIVNELRTYQVGVEIVDPYCDAADVEREYGLVVDKEPTGLYEAVVVAVSHREYRALTNADFRKLIVSGGILVDVKGLFRAQSDGFIYWSL
jgi:UDP-N-acetyl-D-galactosamine dehydrogenase